MFNVWPNSPKERRRGEEAKVFKFAAFSFYSSSPWQCLKSNKMHKDSNFPFGLSIGHPKDQLQQIFSSGSVNP